MARTGNMSDVLAQTKLAELIDASLVEVRALIEILSREQHALIFCESDALAALMTDKRARIAELSMLDQRLRDTLAIAAVPEREAAVSRFLARQDLTGETAARWQTLIQQLRQARRQNRINGATLGLQHQSVERTLRGLRGGTAPAQYDRTGLEPGYDSGRSLGRV